jgi:serine/threonine-protein kinase
VTGFVEEEGKRWREQALRWLRADLAAWTKVLDGNTTSARPKVWQQLTRWRTDPKLAGVREPAQLDRLSAGERKDWLALWAEVGAVLARCRDTP